MPHLSPHVAVSGRANTVLWLLLIMLAALVLAGVVVVYVAFPHRGEEVPGAPWLGDAMRKGVDALPTIDNQRDQQVSSHRLR
jgi:hypothetical protein